MIILGDLIPQTTPGKGLLTSNLSVIITPKVLSAITTSCQGQYALADLVVPLVAGSMNQRRDWIYGYINAAIDALVVMAQRTRRPVYALGDFLCLR